MHDHSAVREGTTAGVIGATAVAIWFLVVDMIAGHALYTPEVLGRALISVLGPGRQDSATLLIAVYTVFHYAAFIVAGIIATSIIHAAHRQSAVLAGALIMFVVFEIGFYGFTALMTETEALGSLAWYQVGLANLIAVALMGVYLWRMHPGIGERLDFALRGDEEPAAGHAAVR